MKTATTTINRPTSPLPPAAVQAMHRIELAFTPPLMSFATSPGATVEVRAVDDSSAPYRWTCSAGHDGGHAYASLPFCRDDARAHAVTCRGASVDVVKLAKVGAALGFRAGWQPRADLGETVTDFSVWSQVELNTVFERVGGTVTTRRVERHTPGCNPWIATELRLTVDVAGVGPVQVWTDLEDESEFYPTLYPTDLPVVHAAQAVTA
ncbi:hypothetical protein ABZ341_18230 [Streptomyces sp. NPDC006173]|uniref:hypothetical protein n=1 Tax=Streptomyces sp. NPDC006173 TaxID=3155349 RepID=UPI0033F70210